MKILGISRSEHFSPNSVERDRSIFCAVKECLLKAGHEVETIGEEAFVAESGYDAIFSMGRSETLLQQLQQLETSGTPIINSPSSLLKDNRAHQADLFKEGGVPIPKTEIDCGIGPKMDFPFWLKRSTCAQSATDVCFVPDEETYHKSIAEMQSNHACDTILQVKHEEGDLVKFYGVAGTTFFSYIFPLEKGNFSKFGLETHNSPFKRYDFSESQLQKAANKAATLTNIDIYGGDAIVRSDGTFVIIDFNDWPSFSTCREEAAKHIAQKIIQMINQND